MQRISTDARKRQGDTKVAEICNLLTKSVEGAETGGEDIIEGSR